MPEVIHPYPHSYSSVPEAFAEAARRFPDRVAVRCGEITWTYAELDCRSSALALQLVELGIRQGDRVAVSCERRIELAAALLGILKAGAAYVPFDLNYPAARLQTMAEQAEAAALIGDPNVAALSHGPTLRFEQLAGPCDPKSKSAEELIASIRTETPAYVMFTSGTTGIPKGVTVPHRAILRLVIHSSFCELGPEEKILQHSPVSFDASTFEVWGPLLNGGEMALYPDPGNSLRGLGNAISKNGITTMWLTAGLFHAFVEERPVDLAPLRQLLTGGDVVSPAHAKKILELCPDLALINGYGPTENTTFTCCHSIGFGDLSEESGAIPIGKPISGTEIHILDEDLNPVPSGEKGELYASGDGLALGYCNDPELTAEKFIVSSWDCSPILYGTGDLASMRKDGVVEFYGRIDQQVKIRGYRIELGEIESAIARFAQVRQVKVVAEASSDQTDKTLIAFYAADREIPRSAFLDHLAALLPTHAIPAFYCRVDEFPLNPNGKIDAKALPKLADVLRQGENAKPQTARRTSDKEKSQTRRIVVEAFSEVLDLDTIPPDCNFFDLGASSIQIARVHEKIQAALDLEFPVTEFFRFTTAASLSAFLDGENPFETEEVLNEKTTGGSDVPIAIVGMAGRFPGAPDVETFWQNLMDGRETISHFSAEDLEYENATARGADPDAIYVRSRGIVDESDCFDAAHFGIPPREAERLDPQHRLILECAQHALEDAGHDPDRFSGKIGFFCGSSQNSYLLHNLCSHPGAGRDLAANYPVSNFETMLGNDKDFLPTRVAYKLNLTGPAVSVQCACSTSLVTVAQACESLRSGACDMALAGGISLGHPQKRDYLYTPDGIASRDGHCRAFDEKATGTVFGEGAGLVALRRLADALADGDHIVAVIRGFALNNDGSTKAGYAAPSVEGQSKVIREAHQNAGIEPEDIGYVEAHGTGTPLGDPIEFAALRSAFGDAGHCYLGTAKTNVGHLDIAAGITGLIKTALTVSRGEIPPLLHFNKANPKIDFENSSFEPVTDPVKWNDSSAPRRAGVSAFGVGGTNVHMVLEQAPGKESSVGDSTGCDQEHNRVPSPIFPFSASHPGALNASIRQFGDYLKNSSGSDLESLSYTLQTGRREYTFRTALTASSISELGSLATNFKGRIAEASQKDEVIFLFPGQGSQHPGMAKELYENEPVYRAAFDECVEIIRRESEFDLIERLYPDKATKSSAAKLKETQVAQPAIFATEYALAKLWSHWGVEPALMAGHSIGEFAAACLAGVFELRDALALICLRGKLMSELPEGAMISVRASVKELKPYLTAEVNLAAENGAESCVISGPSAAAAEVAEKLQAAGVETKSLHTSHAFHSSMMDEIVEPFQKEVARRDLNPPQCPIVSTVTGDWMSDAEATDPRYWATHLRRPVLFYQAVQKLWDRPSAILLECGPGRTLATLAGQNPDRKNAQPCLSSLPHAAKDESSRSHLRTALGMLWSHGLPVDWDRAEERSCRPCRLPLPGYRFQRKRFWIEPAKANHHPAESATDSRPAEEPVLAAEAIAEAPGVQAGLQSIFAELSGHEPSELDENATFLELGFDSLLLTQAGKEIQDAFRVKVTLRQLIDEFPTIAALTNHLESQGAATAGATKEVRKSTSPVSNPEETKQEQPKVSGPATVIDREVSDDELTKTQRDHLDRLVERYTAKTAQSKSLTEKYRPFHADPRTASGFNRTWKEMVYQIVTVRSKGSRLLDVDGNEYIDLLNGFGPGFLGHSTDFLVEAVEEQLRKGYEVGPQSLLAMEAAELFCEVTGNDRTSFVCTGSEAVQAAMRLARTVTNRDKIVIFARDYHGNFDEVLVRGVNGKGGALKSLPVAPGIPKASAGNMIVLPYGTDQSLEVIRELADQLAAVIVEPVQSRRPEFRPREFIREVRRITEDSGSLFVFDEVVTGFRFGPRGAQEYYGVEADLCTYGKVIGGEMPLGVVSGKADYMDTFDGGVWNYGDDSFPERPVTFFAGTFVRHPLAMASVKAMLVFLRDQPPHFWHQINAKGDRLAGTIDAYFRDHRVPMEMPNCGSLMFVRMGENQKYGNLFFYHLREKGVFMLEGFPSYMTAAHNRADIDYVIDAFRESVAEMQKGGFFPESSALGNLTPGSRLCGPSQQLQENGSPPETDFLAPICVPTTEPQREILAASRLGARSSCAFNESATLHLKGKLNRPALESAFAQLVERHDALRSVYSADGTTMTIQPCCEIPIEYRDLRKDSAQLKRILREDASKPYDLKNGPLVRPYLLQLEEELHHLVISAHHIVCDGWSYNVLSEELCELYNAASSGQLAQLPAPKQYSQHALEWSRYSDSQRRAEEKYWLEKFSDLPEPLDLPIDRPYPAERTYRGDTYEHRINRETYEAVKSAGAKLGSTLYSTLAAVYQLMLHRLTGQDDLVVCIPSAGQNDGENTEYLVGHCVNFLPLRTRYNPEDSFDSFLKHSRGVLLEATDHRSYTYGELVQQLDTERDPRRMPLLEVAFNVERMDYFGQWQGLEAVFEPNGKTHVHYTMFMNIVESADGLRIDVDYNSEVLDRQTVARWTRYFENLTGEVVRDPSLPVSELSVIGRNEEKRLLLDWNQPENSGFPSQTAAQLFEEQVRQTPHATALMDGENEISYTELDKMSNRAAHSLSQNGVAPGDFVAVIAHRGANTVAALLGILKTGAAYVPIDPNYPADRIEYILNDSAASVVLVDEDIEFQTNESRTAVSLEKALKTDVNSFACHSGVNSDPAYVIYTSGSTGKPKGVVIPHRGIARLVRNTNYFDFGPDETFLLSAPITFDASTFELWGPLLNGGRLAVMPPGVSSLQDIGRAVQKHNVTVLWLTSGLFSLMVDERPEDLFGLSHIFSGGDVLSKHHVAKAMDLLGPKTALVNAYGPTESTTFTTCHRIRPEDLERETIPIGSPIDYTSCYILDGKMNPVPLGVKGRLYIGGDGLALGYLNNETLTREKFVEHDREDLPDPILYDSGDECRWLPDGSIDFIGRADRQVKIRGFRIEPGEIESVIAQASGVEQATVQVIGKNSAEKRLVAYVVGDCDLDELTRNLGEKLPEYMIPGQFVSLEELPITANGKVDYKALPIPDGSVASVDGEPQEEARALNETEKKVADLWSEILGCGPVSLHHNFFKLGGHSLAGLRLFNRIHHEFDKDLPLATLFQAPTVRSLSARIDAEKSVKSAPQIVTRISEGSLGETPLFLIHGGDGGTLFYKPFTDGISHYREIYTIEAPMSVDPDCNESADSIESTVDLYLKSMEEHYQGERYAIGGYSFGGVVAYEMACQLQKSGAEVECLYLFDTPNPVGIENFRTSLFGRVRSEWSEVEGANLAAKLACAGGRIEERAKNKARHLRNRARLRKLGGKVSQRELNSLRVFQINEAHNRLMENYVPAPYGGEVCLFRADNRAEGYDFDRSMGWSDLILDLTVRDVPGSHEEIFDSPYVETLTNTFNELFAIHS